MAISARSFRTLGLTVVVLMTAATATPAQLGTGLPPTTPTATPSVTGARLDAAPVAGMRLVVAGAADQVVGALVEVIGTVDPGGTPPLLDPLARTNGAKRVRRFGGQLFAISRDAGTLRRVPLNGGASQLYDLGMGSEPMDVLVPGAPFTAPGTAYVTRRNVSTLLELDLATGATWEAVDLAPVGGGQPIALGTMIRRGSRLFVQVRVFEDREAPGGDLGVLAVVDLTDGTLVDVDVNEPGTQGIALLGAPPRFDMQLLGDSLYVSTTDTFNDVRGGIERVDLTTLSSTGYVISEATGHSDMGGFVMLDATRGYYVFHTDLLTSTHLVAFSVAGGPEPDGLIDLLGDTVDQLIYDEGSARLFLPSGFGFTGTGLFVFSTDTNALLGPPVPTGLAPQDAVLVQAGLPFALK